LDEGLYPYTKRYLGGFGNHFSTIGLIGMNEAGLNANWLRKDITHKETQEFAVKVLNFMRNRLSDYQEEYEELFNLEATPAESPPTGLQNMIRSSSRILSQQRKGTVLHTIRTVPIFRLDFPMIFLTRWIFRTSFRRSIHREPYSTHSWERSFRAGRNRRFLYGRLPRIISFHTIRFLRPTPSARITAILTANSIPARTAERRRRFTAGSPDTTVRYRTGTMERFRSLKTGKNMISNIL